MKVTVRFDEAAAMTPSEVKIKQAAREYARERNRQWSQCSAQINKPLGFGVALAAVWPNGGGK